MNFLIRFIDTFFEILTLALVARILLSWFQSTSKRGGLYQFIFDITEPILRLARQITPRTGMLDFSPLIALIGLDLLRNLIIRILVSL